MGILTMEITEKKTWNRSATQVAVLLWTAAKHSFLHLFPLSISTLFLPKLSRGAWQVSARFIGSPPVASPLFYSMEAPLGNQSWLGCLRAGMCVHKINTTWDGRLFGAELSKYTRQRVGGEVMLSKVFQQVGGRAGTRTPVPESQSTGLTTKHTTIAIDSWPNPCNWNTLQGWRK